METFPIIHMNFWDAIIAVPLVIIFTQIVKWLLPIPKSFIPGLATVIGLIISIFFAHRHNLWAGNIYGFFLRKCCSRSICIIKNANSSFEE